MLPWVQTLENRGVARGEANLEKKILQNIRTGFQENHDREWAVTVLSGAFCYGKRKASAIVRGWEKELQG